jgi:hypothetical protein
MLLPLESIYVLALSSLSSAHATEGGQVVLGRLFFQRVLALIIGLPIVFIRVLCLWWVSS